MQDLYYLKDTEKYISDQLYSISNLSIFSLFFISHQMNFYQASLHSEYHQYINQDFSQREKNQDFTLCILSSKAT